MSITLQKSKNQNLGSFWVVVKDKTYVFNAGLSVRKYGREKALLYARELKAIAKDKRIALPTRRRLFDARRKQMKTI